VSMARRPCPGFPRVCTMSASHGAFAGLMSMPARWPARCGPRPPPPPPAPQRTVRTAEDRGPHSCSGGEDAVQGAAGGRTRHPRCAGVICWSGRSRPRVDVVDHAALSGSARELPPPPPGRLEGAAGGGLQRRYVALSCAYVDLSVTVQPGGAGVLVCRCELTPAGSRADDRAEVPTDLGRPRHDRSGPDPWPAWSRACICDTPRSPATCRPSRCRSGLGSSQLVSSGRPRRLVVGRR